MLIPKLRAVISPRDKRFNLLRVANKSGKIKRRTEVIVNAPCQSARANEPKFQNENDRISFLLRSDIKPPTRELAIAVRAIPVNIRTSADLPRVKEIIKRDVKKAPVAAASITVKSPIFPIPKRIAMIAPSDAPLDTPRNDGSTIGFINIAWVSRPAKAIAKPAEIAVATRGRRICSIISGPISPIKIAIGRRIKRAIRLTPINTG